MTTDSSVDAARPPRTGLRAGLSRLGRAVQVLLVAAFTIGAVPTTGMIVVVAVQDQVLSTTGTRTQAMVVGHGRYQDDLVVAFQTLDGQRVRATIGLWDGEPPGDFPVERLVGVIYDPDHPSTADLEAHLLGTEALLSRIASAAFGLALLAFSLGLIGYGVREARRALAA